MDKRATASLIFAAVLVVAIAGVWVALSEATVTGNVPGTPTMFPAPRCTSNAACNDNNDCTSDRCTPNGCTYANVDDCRPCRAGFCMGGKCVNMLDASCPTPSPSPSPTPSQSPYPWVTPSPSPYPWATPSPYPSPSPEETPSPSPYPVTPSPAPWETPTPTLPPYSWETPVPTPYSTPEETPSPFPTPKPKSCEHLQEITAAVGWFMKRCKIKINPLTGEYAFAVTFGF